MADRVGKEWSPKKFTSSQVEAALVESLEENIDNQRTLTRYHGPDEGFHQYVADGSWDHYRYKLIGENTGCLLCVLGLAEELGIFLPKGLVRRAELYAYTS